jgi:hypothetical protein
MMHFFKAFTAKKCAVGLLLATLHYFEMDDGKAKNVESQNLDFF